VAVHTPLLHRLDALKEVKWKIYSFRLPLLTGSFREGILLHFPQENRWGEIAPFPGRSKESLPQALAQLLKLLKTGKTDEELFPSVQFGLERALSSPVAVSAPLYALLSGDRKTILHQANVALDQGYTTVKLKISSLSLNDSRDIIHNLKERFRLRVDCNSAFTFDQALRIFEPFDKTIFDYIEDPTFELKRLSEFPYPVALDETVLQYRQFDKLPNLYGFILKPTILGGKKGCTPLVEFAKKNQLKVVFSPAFESGLGLLQILALAKEFNLTTEPLGLDTHRYLKHDLLMPAVNFNKAQLTVSTAPQINLDLLTEISHGTCDLPSV
jgi:o-succinylbenzoate synthase